MENSTLKQELLEAINNLQIPTFFRKVDENLDANNIELMDRAIYSQLKLEYVAGNIAHNFYNRLTILTESIVIISHITKYDDLLNFVKEISENINEILVTNQKVLLPYIKSEINRDIATETMTELFEVQEKRNLFGKWISYLQKSQENVSNSLIKEQIVDITNLLKEIKITLYESSSFEIMTEEGITKSFFPKGVVAEMLYSIRYQEGKQIIRMYLDNLRQKSEKIGEILGNIEFEINR